ncbi:MAG: DUF92 domain-containing protein [Abditibacteriales bacterium]|nr:DUF92 domain-containing protein [Abditibacteriales bacterium]
MIEIGWAMLVNLLFAAVGVRAGSMNLGGAACGAMLGCVVYVCLDWRGYVILAAFVILGSAMTRLGYERKLQLGGAQTGGGKRGAAHALAKLSVGAACALLASALPDPHGRVWTIAFVAAFAAALADTTGTELGQLYGKRPVLLPTFRPVPVGTEGAVSLEGTVLGLLGAAVLAGAAGGLRLIRPLDMGVVVLASFVGIIAESLLARTGWNNHLLNFLLTALSALVAAAVALACAPPHF